jgi:hypothetical protein
MQQQSAATLILRKKTFSLCYAIPLEMLIFLLVGCTFAQNPVTPAFKNDN